MNKVLNKTTKVRYKDENYIDTQLVPNSKLPKMEQLHILCEIYGVSTVLEIALASIEIQAVERRRKLIKSIYRKL
jgi:hypothetical protein